MLEAFFAVFIPLLIIVNPSSTLALFSILTRTFSKERRIKTARNAVIYAAILLIIFALGGSAILGYLGISIPALRIAGGILLATVGLDMLRRGEQFGETPPDKKQQVTDIALVPLAILLTMIISFLVFMGSVLISKLMGKRGMDALTRVMGLLTVAIAVQFTLTGIGDWIATLTLPVL